jgi:hypothetical protein
MNALQPSLRIVTRRLDSPPETELNLEQFAGAMARLYQLLEEYAPAWYTQRRP